MSGPQIIIARRDHHDRVVGGFREKTLKPAVIEVDAQEEKHISQDCGGKAHVEVNPDEVFFSEKRNEIVIINADDRKPEQLREHKIEGHPDHAVYQQDVAGSNKK